MELKNTISTIFTNQGWKVKLWPFWLTNSQSFPPDFVAEKQGLTVAIISKSGLGTITDIAIARRVPVQKKIVVADAWASANAANLARDKKVELVAQKDLVEYLKKLTARNLHNNIISRFLGWLQFQTLGGSAP